MDLISVVVPIYNVELYLRKCLDTIISQTYRNLEIILVNDGSVDESRKICEEYASKDDRIILINKENGGASSARNLGMENAKGKYICFLDSDDCYDAEYLEKMYNTIISENCDMVVSNFKYTYPDGSVKSSDAIFEYTVLRGEEILDSLLKKYYLLLTFPSNKLYDKKIFENLRYTEGIIHEDDDIAYKIMHLCNKVVILPDELYFYLVRPNSVMTGSSLDKHVIVVEILRRRHEYIFENNCSKYAISTSAYLSLLQYLIYANKYYKIGDKDKYYMLMNELGKISKIFFPRCKFIYKVKFIIKFVLCKIHLLSLVGN